MIVRCLGKLANGFTLMSEMYYSEFVVNQNKKKKKLVIDEIPNIIEDLNVKKELY